MKRAREDDVLPNAKRAKIEIYAIEDNIAKKRSRDENNINQDLPIPKKIRKEDENYRQFLREEEEKLNKYFSIVCL